jgi:hypothetical protein
VVWSFLFYVLILLCFLSYCSEGAPLPSVTVNMAATDSCLVSCFPVPPCSYYLMLANLFHLIVFSLTWNFKHRSNLGMGFFLMVRLGNSEHFVEICNLSDPLTPETTSPLSNNSTVVWVFVELWLFRRKVTRVISQDWIRSSHAVFAWSKLRMVNLFAASLAFTR